MAVIALKCPQIEAVVDVNPDRIADWNSEDLTKLPTTRFGGVVDEARGETYFSTDVEGSIKRQK